MCRCARRWQIPERQRLLSSPDVFFPQLRVGRDELVHHRNALLVLDYGDFHATGVEELFLAGEGPALADDDPGYAVEQNGAAAHRAGRKSRVQGAVLISRC